MGKKEVIQRLIHKYKTGKYKREGWRGRLRNKIFLLMQENMKNWIKGHLSKWKKYEEETMILSMSWDAFLFCLERYDNPAYDLYSHFNIYTRYFLLLSYISEKSKLETERYLEETKMAFHDGLLTVGSEGTYDIVDRLSELKSFRGKLPVKYHKIFDNTVLGIHPRIALGKTLISRQDRAELSYYKYYGLREAFKIIINGLLRG